MLPVCLGASSSQLDASSPFQKRSTLALVVVEAQSLWHTTGIFSMAMEEDMSMAPVVAVLTDPISD